MKKGTRFVGLDVHKDSIAVAVAEDGREGEVRSLGTIPNTGDAVQKLLKRLGPADTLRVCYEAGPCGYVLYWQLAKLGIACEVIAPSLIPVKAGDRVKTDRRDAEKLARCYRAGELVDPVEDDDVKVDIEVQRSPEALHEGDGPAAGCVRRARHVRGRRRDRGVAGGTARAVCGRRAGCSQKVIHWAGAFGWRPRHGGSWRPLAVCPRAAGAWSSVWCWITVASGDRTAGRRSASVVTCASSAARSPPAG